MKEKDALGRAMKSEYFVGLELLTKDFEKVLHLWLKFRDFDIVHSFKMYLNLIP